jgi:hypothetical protein
MPNYDQYVQVLPKILLQCFLKTSIPAAFITLTNSKTSFFSFIFSLRAIQISTSKKKGDQLLIQLLLVVLK